MAAPVPSVERLLALSTDDWSALLAAALPVLRGLPDELRDDTSTRLASVPPARLVTGRPRAQLAAAVRRTGVWPRVAAALDDDVLAALGSASDPASAGSVDDEELAAARARADDAVALADAAAERATDLRERLDEARRAAEGATARAESAERRARDAESVRDEALARADALREQLERAADEQARAVERERRRLGSRDQRDRDELREARRRTTALEQELAGLRRALEAARAEAASSQPGARRREQAPRSSGERGRPSVLPEGLVRGTREAASWLVAAGVPLLVDGYNVTRTQRPEATFEEQRAWLEGAVAALAQRRGVRATIVWDSTLGASTHRRRDGVTVRFTTPEMTADDELVLHVRTLLEPDDPVVVVTDDAELRGRLGVLGVDLLDTTSFAWLLR